MSAASSPYFTNDNRVSPVSLATLTAGEVAALPGNNTDIAVGTGNNFVTQTGLEHNAEKYAADTGTADVMAIALSPIPTSLTAGMVIYVKAKYANATTTPTINVNSLGAKTIIKGVSSPLVAGDIAANQFITLIYDGANFVLQNPTILTQQGLRKSGIVTISTATTTTITVGFQAKSITIYGNASVSVGTWNAVDGNHSVISGTFGSGGGTSSTYIFQASDNVYSDYTRGYVTNVTATTFDLVSSVGGTLIAYLLWQAEA